MSRGIGTHRSLCPCSHRQSTAAPRYTPRPEHSTRCWLPFAPRGSAGPALVAMVRPPAPPCRSTSFGSCSGSRGLAWFREWVNRALHACRGNPSHASSYGESHRWRGRPKFDFTQLASGRLEQSARVTAQLVFVRPRPTGHDESHAHPIIVFQSHVPVCSLTVWSSPYDDIPSDKGSASLALAKWCMGKHCP